MKAIEKIQKGEDEGRVVFSFELFPPKVEDGINNIFKKMDRTVTYNHFCCDINWGAGGSTADLTLDIAKRNAEHGQRRLLLCVGSCSTYESYYGDYFGIIVARYPEAHPN